MRPGCPGDARPPHSHHLERVRIGRVRPRRRSAVQVPERRRGDVVLKRKVAAAGAPPEGLDADAQRRVEANRIEDVPAVHAEALLTAVEPVWPEDLMQSEVWAGVGRVARTRHVEVPRTSEVVLGPGAADRGMVCVTVEVELYLALAPPSGRVHSPGEIRADVVSPPGDTVDERVHVLV